LSGSCLVLAPQEPPVGGVSRYGAALARLLESRPGGAALFDPRRVERAESGRFLARACRRLFSREAPRVVREARRLRAGLLIDNFQFLWTRPAYARGLALGRRRPYLLVVHDGAFPNHLRGLDPVARRRLRRALGRATAAACMSRPIQEALGEVVPGIPTFRLNPLLEGPPGSGTPLSDEAERFLRSHQTILATSGAAAPLYGLEDLLEALPAILAAGMDAGLVVLLGTFTREPSTVRALQEAQRAHPGRILVREDDPEGAALVARSRVYVRPSRIDSFGLALHEALLAAVPAVAAEHPTRPPGVLLYPPGDARACAEAVLAALRPEALDAARRLRPRIERLLEENRRATLAAVDWTARGGLRAAPT
jgi:glycosyltransferase involved in cell wall biosynthesis